MEELFPGIEIVEESPKEFQNLSYQEFKKLFGDELDKNEFKAAYDEYKKDKTKLPDNLLVIAQAIQDAEEELIREFTVRGVDEDLIRRNRDKLIELSARSRLVPIGLVEVLDDVETFDELPDKAYLNMIRRDCNAEIKSVLKTLGLYRDITQFAKQFDESGFAPSGYDGSINVVREVLNLPEPDRCTIYKFSEENIRGLMSELDNDDFKRELKILDLDAQFKAWLEERLPDDADIMDFDDSANHARNILGIADITFPTREERLKEERKESVLTAVALMQEVDPSYNISKLNLEKLGISKEELEIKEKKSPIEIVGDVSSPT